jgi:hypothetical protein
MRDVPVYIATRIKIVGFSLSIGIINSLIMLIFSGNFTNTLDYIDAFFASIILPAALFQLNGYFVMPLFCTFGVLIFLLKNNHITRVCFFSSVLLWSIVGSFIVIASARF